MTSPSELARLAARSLRYFVYTRPHGGFGGDWDLDRWLDEVGVPMVQAHRG